jgi:hypothetical protein
MPDSEIGRAGAIEMIRAHIVEHGERDWAIVRARLPDISDATFWRYVRRTRSGAPAPSVGEARRRLAVAANASCDALAGPSVGMTADLGVHLAQLFHDVDLLRAYSMKDGTVKIPTLFTQAIGLRERAILAAVKSRDAILYEAEATAFYKAVVDEVAAVDGAVAHRIMMRLTALQGRSSAASGSTRAL